jgi:hypothetical protein
VRRVSAATDKGAGQSTAAVLWLMILLVFAPIGAAHVVARQMAEPHETATGTAGPAHEGAAEGSVRKAG